MKTHMEPSRRLPVRADAVAGYETTRVTREASKKSETKAVTGRSPTREDNHAASFCYAASAPPLLHCTAKIKQNPLE